MTSTTPPQTGQPVRCAVSLCSPPRSLGLGAPAPVRRTRCASYAPPALAQNLSQEAQTVARPIGFADIVEKVKPAVISVRVKMNAEPADVARSRSCRSRKGSPMEQFFRRFGMPDGMPNLRRMRRAAASSAPARAPASSSRPTATP